MSDINLPEEIILQILHKLPIKSLFCCLYVCKSWHSLIKNPSFISTHLTLTTTTSTTNKNLLFFRLCWGKRDCSKNSEHHSLRFDNNQEQLADPYMLFDFPFKTYNPCFHVIGCFNGIICLVDDLLSYGYTFILWNPLIKKALILPKPSFTFNTHGHYIASVGFGFDFKNNDYKVLRVVLLQDEFIEVELYSLSTNSWKSMTSVAPKYEFSEPGSQAFVNGVLHWVAFKRMGNGKSRNVVLGFDIGDEVFLEIKLPESLANVIPISMSVRKYGDSSIAVIHKSLDASDRIQCQCHIWVMKEYGVVGSWTKLLSLVEQGGGLPTVLGFSKSGEVLLEMYGGQIVSCDPRDRGIKDLGLGKQEGFPFVDDYVESLVLLDQARAVTDANAANDVIEDEHQ